MSDFSSDCPRNKPRVLHVVYRMGVGGIETFIMNLYRQMKDDVQFDFVVYAEKPGEYEDEIRQYGGTVYRMAPRGRNFTKYAAQWESFFRTNSDKYAAIHMHVSSLTTIFPLIIAKKYGVPVRIVHAHSTQQPGIVHAVLRNINKLPVRLYATDLLACSNEAGQFVFGRHQFRVINNGMELNKYNFDNKLRYQIRSELGISKDDLAYVHVGRFTYAKNHNYLLRVFREITLLEKHSRLFLIGAGELEDDIKQQIEELGLSKHVTLLGLRNDVPKLLQGMDMLLFPSNYEGLPLAVIEAQAAGLPSIVSDRISKDVKISDYVEFLPIEIPPAEWAKKSVCNGLLDDKARSRRELYDKKYDIVSIADELMRIYLGGERDN